MALSTFAELKASIQSWLYNRPSIAAVAADFVRLNEALMDGTVRHPLMATTVEITFDGTEFADLPTDFRGAITLANETQIITPVTLEQIASDKLTVTTSTNKRFAILGDQLQVWPVPANGDTATLVYMQAIPNLAADGDTNWLLTRYPNAYLYGSLLQAAPYLDKDDRIPVWQGLFATALGSIEESARQERWGRGVNVRSGGPTP